MRCRQQCHDLSCQRNAIFSQAAAAIGCASGKTGTHTPTALGAGQGCGVERHKYSGLERHLLHIHWMTAVAPSRLAWPWSTLKSIWSAKTTLTARLPGFSYILGDNGLTAAVHGGKWWRWRISRTEEGRKDGERKERQMDQTMWQG